MEGQQTSKTPNTNDKSGLDVQKAWKRAVLSVVSDFVKKPFSDIHVAVSFLVLNGFVLLG